MLVTSTESIETKICTTCNTERPIIEYDTGKASNGKLYIRSKCKVCRRIDQIARQKARGKHPNLKLSELSPEKREQLRARRRDEYTRRIDRIKRAYVAENGIPQCGCGCGNEVLFGIDGPYKFLDRHQFSDEGVLRAIGQSNSERLAAKRVTLDKIQPFLKNYKEKNGLTWEQMAQLTGVGHKHLKSIAYKKPTKVHKGISKTLASHIIDRLAGKGTVPTRYDHETIQIMKSKQTVSHGNLYGMVIVKNEADRYLHAFLEWHHQFFDRLLIVDDSSDDETYEMCLSYTGDVLHRPEGVPTFMEDESALRQYAWDSVGALFGAKSNDWIMSLDADEFLAGTREDLNKAREEAIIMDVDSVRFRVAEIWQHDDTGIYRRCDGFWHGKNIRLGRWEDNLSFKAKKMGCGSLPSVLAWNKTALNDDLTILHYGYTDPDDRLAKYKRYSGKEDHGHNKQHINSIMDKPKLEKWEGIQPLVWKGVSE